MADAADKFIYPGDPGTATNLAGSGYTAGGTSITVDTTTGWPTATGVIFSMDTVTVVNNEEVRDEGSYTVYAGVVTSGTTIGSVSKLFGDVQNYTAGASTRVYITTSALWSKRLIEGLLVGHTAAGAHNFTQVLDTNGNESLKLGATASAVNEITLTNAATGDGPTVSATGGDTNIDLNFSPKGTGKVKGVVNNLHNPYKFSVYRSAALTVSTGDRKVNFDTELFDTGSNFDSTTNFRFTAPIAGFYQLDAQVSISLASGLVPYVSFYKNGVVERRGNLWTTAAIQDSNLRVSGLIQLAATDYIEVFIFNPAGGSSTINVGTAPLSTYFSGHLVSAT